MMKRKESVFIFAMVLMVSLVFYITDTGYSATAKPSAQEQGASGIVKPSVDSHPYPITAELHASPTVYTGKCPATIRFIGKITVPRLGKLRYRFIRSDHATAPVQTIAFPKAGSKMVSASWRLGGPPLPSYTGWMAIQILDMDVESNKAEFRIQCAGLPGQQSNLPDLVIDDIKLDQNCNVMVRVRNAGPGHIADEVWTVYKPESSGVYLTVDGQGWGGETIWKFDPDKHLKAPGGTAIYRSTCRITATAFVQATIDHTKQVNEQNDQNNTRTERLTCQQ